ncbi:MAG: DUF1003 domain-containing protein [Jatrophihabitans sp.]|uniref:DUF1003 domain-containing protein n=1 Tax=Jatrophihabitans sp. TaxID=1932789 RepID=UPI003F823107
MSEPRFRLDQPRFERRTPRFRVDPEAFGQWTEGFARFLGTGRFLVIQTLIILVWIVENYLPGVPHFDPYPFQFLTLVLSLQAAYAAPLILLAQNRQDDRDRVNLEADRDEARESKADLEYLAREIAAIRMAVGEVATRDFLRSEVTRLAESRDGRDDKPVKEPKAPKQPKQPKVADTPIAPVERPVTAD